MFAKNRNECFFPLNHSRVILNLLACTTWRGIIRPQISCLNHSTALESVCPTHWTGRMWARPYDLRFNIDHVSHLKQQLTAKGHNNQKCRALLPGQAAKAWSPVTFSAAPHRQVSAHLKERLFWTQTYSRHYGQTQMHCVWRRAIAKNNCRLRQHNIC